MVNHGVSQGCARCKQRRKKCDETWPTCRRCYRAGLTCSGPAATNWHYYVAANNVPPRPFQSEAMDSQKAIHIFISDAQIHNAFFHGFQQLLTQTGPDSLLVQAASLVTLANLGNRMQRLGLKIEASKRYSQLLKNSASIGNVPRDLVLERMTTAALLDVYEIINTDESGSIGHGFHTRGTAAILSCQMSPTEMASELHKFQQTNALFLQGPLLHTNSSESVCAPSSSPPVQGLDSILLRWNDLVRTALLFSENPPQDYLQETRKLLQDASVLDGDFIGWEASLASDWKPQKVVMIDTAAAESSASPYIRPGRVDKYTSLYISTVWNTARKAHLMLLQIMAQCAISFSHMSLATNLQQQAIIIADDIASSVPFHLSRDVHELLGGRPGGSHDMQPGKIAGGMLIMHPLLVAASCIMLPHEQRSYFKQCLKWIGLHMGIGQATWMARQCDESVVGASPMTSLNQECHFRPQRTAEGHTIYWSGLLAG